MECRGSRTSSVEQNNAEGVKREQEAEQSIVCDELSQQARVMVYYWKPNMCDMNKLRYRVKEANCGCLLLCGDICDSILMSYRSSFTSSGLDFVSDDTGMYVHSHDDDTYACHDHMAALRWHAMWMRMWMWLSMCVAIEPCTERVSWTSTAMSMYMWMRETMHPMITTSRNMWLEKGRYTWIWFNVTCRQMGITLQCDTLLTGMPPCRIHIMAVHSPNSLWTHRILINAHIRCIVCCIRSVMICTQTLVCWCGPLHVYVVDMLTVMCHAVWTSTMMVYISWMLLHTQRHIDIHIYSDLKQLMIMRLICDCIFGGIGTARLQKFWTTPTEHSNRHHSNRHTCCNITISSIITSRSLLQRHCNCIPYIIPIPPCRAHCFHPNIVSTHICMVHLIAFHRTPLPSHSIPLHPYQYSPRSPFSICVSWRTCLHVHACGRMLGYCVLYGVCCTM